MSAPCERWAERMTAHQPARLPPHISRSSRSRVSTNPGRQNFHLSRSNVLPPISSASTCRLMGKQVACTFAAAGQPRQASQEKNSPRRQPLKDPWSYCRRIMAGRRVSTALSAAAQHDLLRALATPRRALLILWLNSGCSRERKEPKQSARRHQFNAGRRL